MNVAIQPCSDADAQQHYLDTILNPVAASRVLPHLSSGDRTRFEASCGGTVAVWGVTSGKKGVNRNKWAKLGPGDVAILYRDKKLFSQGRICLCIRNRALALDLWKTNAGGDTWEYIYFLDDLQEVDIPLATYNATMGYKPNAIVQGFNVYEGARAATLIDLLEIDVDADLNSGLGIKLDFESTATKLAAIQSMNNDAKAQARAEAAPLRDYLFGGKRSDRCDMCGKVFPTGLLVAAHIKKRASCTDGEKRDPYIVMRACKLGCDELYERGYISVDATGTLISAANLANASPDLVETIKRLLGLKCLAFGDSTRAYFDWHRLHPRRFLQ